MVYQVVSAGKTFKFKYHLPADQVPSGKNVYVDIIDANGNYVGDPIQLSRIPDSDIVHGEITAPSNLGQYIIRIWIGTWDGSSRTIDEIVDEFGLEVVSKDLEDRVSDLESEIQTLKQEVEYIKKVIRRHPA